MCVLLSEKYRESRHGFPKKADLLCYGNKKNEGVKFMIEIIYNESKADGSTVTVKPPKNIRQIGIPKGRHKIYVEDYVYTFLHSSAFEGISQKRAAVLLGRSEMTQDIRYTFISGAVSCEAFVLQEGGILFDEVCWEYIYKEIKQYFDNQEIVGWFLGLTGFPLELTPPVEAAHRKYFAGRDKVLLLSEPAEGEDVFYSYEQGILQKKEGYYVFYEKNMPMQEYMVSTREKAREREGGVESRIREREGGEENRIREQEGGVENCPTESEIGVSPEDVSEKYFAIEEKEEPNSPAEQALREYRSALLERQVGVPQKKMSILLYTAASAAMVILCVIGVTTMNNYEKMRAVEQALTVMSQAAEQETEPEDVQETEPEDVQETEPEDVQETVPESVQESGVTVESVPGEVSPQQDNTEGQQPPEEHQVEEEQLSAEEQQAIDTAAAAKAYLEQGYYIVQPGDKLELICKSIYQTTAMLDKICEVNQIEDMDKIYAGQKLILP